MKKILVFLLLTASFVFPAQIVLDETPELFDLVEYYVGNTCVFRMVYDGSVDPLNPPIVETNAVVVGRIRKWTPPKEQLLKLHECGSKFNLIVIHGMDPGELDGLMTPYKVRLSELFKRIGERLKINTYLFVYSTLLAEPEKVAQAFNELTASMENIVIFAHSMGGLIAEHVAEKSGNVLGIVFSGVPHLGSPFADVLFVHPKDFEKVLGLPKSKAENLRTILVLSYNSFNVVHAPGYRNLLWGRVPRDFSRVHHVNLVGKISLKGLSDVSTAFFNMLRTSFRDTAALLSLKLISESISELKPEFSETDGVVPVASASFGGNVLMYQADHEDLYVNEEIVYEGISYILLRLLEERM